MLMNNLRQTGRTTRMLEEAKRLLEQGQKVVIGTAHFSERNLINDMARRMNLPDGYKVELASKLNIDWFNLTLIDIAPKTHFLLDHAVIEIRYPKLLEALHRFDKKEETT